MSAVPAINNFATEVRFEAYRLDLAAAEHPPVANLRAIAFRLKTIASRIQDFSDTLDERKRQAERQGGPDPEGETALV
ncbi:MAG TPA: hypothetical protein VNA25_14570 [Phycisphaerae bacterium]|nr:hypothetical protein [Phycisphaerae bacterium]